MPESVHSGNPGALTSSFGGLVAEIYDRIYSQLLTVAIEPGQRLSVDALAREFEVSQTPIRAALSRLESDGLVVKNHLRGYRATATLTRDEIDNLFELRIMLETYSARRAAVRRTTEQLSELQRLDDAMSRSDRMSPDGSGYGEFTALDRRMHGVIAEACGNDLVRDALARLHGHLHIYRVRRTVVDQALNEHHMVLEGIRMGDRNIAEAAMRTHLERARDRVLVAFD